MIEKGINFLLGIDVKGKRLTKIPPELIATKPIKKYPMAIKLLGLWGLSYLRQRIAFELVDAGRKLASFRLTVVVDPQFRKFTEKIASDPDARREFVKEFRSEIDKYEEEAERINIAPVITAKQLFGEFVDIEEALKGFDPAFEKRRLTEAKKQLDKLDKFFLEEITPFFKEELKLLKRQKYDRKKAQKRIGDIEYNLKRNMPAAIAEYIVWHAKTIPWMKEMFHIAERATGLSAGPEKAVQKQLSALIRTFHSRDPAQMGNISRIFATRTPLMQLKKGEKEFNVREFIYYSSKPINLLEHDEYANFLNSFLVEIAFREDKRQGLVISSRELREETDQIQVRLKTEDMSERQRDLLATKYNRIRKQRSIIPAKIKNLEEDIDRFAQAYSDFKKAQGDERKIAGLRRDYRDMMRYTVKPPREPFLSWWRTKTGEHLVFPNMASEYQYFYSLFVKRGKQDLIKGMKAEWFKPITVLPRFSLWSKHHLRQVAKWFGREFKTMSEAVEKKKRGEAEPTEITTIKMFNTIGVMANIRNLTEGEGFREVNRKFLDDMQSALHMIRTSLDADFKHDPMTGKQYPEIYRLEKKDILPFPKSWNPGMKLYEKKEIDSYLQKMEEIQKSFRLLELQRKRAKITKKRPDVREKEFKNLKLGHQWRLFKQYPTEFGDMRKSIRKNLEKAFHPGFWSDIRYYCGFTFPFAKGKKVLQLHLWELPEKYKQAFIYRKSWGLELLEIETALQSLFNKKEITKKCKQANDPEIADFFKELTITKPPKPKKVMVKITIPGTDKTEKWEQETIEWWPSTLWTKFEGAERYMMKGRRAKKEK
jgi:hypothetical protein